MYVNLHVRRKVGEYVASVCPEHSRHTAGRPAYLQSVRPRTVFKKGNLHFIVLFLTFAPHHHMQPQPGHQKEDTYPWASIAQRTWNARLCQNGPSSDKDYCCAINQSEMIILNDLFEENHTFFFGINPKSIILYRLISFFGIAISISAVLLSFS